MNHVSEAWLSRYGSFRARVTPHGMLVIEHDSVARSRIPFHVAFELVRASVACVAPDAVTIQREPASSWIALPDRGPGLTMIRSGRVAVPRGTSLLAFECASRAGSFLVSVPVVRDMRELPSARWSAPIRDP